MSEILIFQVVSVAEQAGLNLTLSDPEDRFCRVEAHIYILLGGGKESIRLKCQVLSKIGFTEGYFLN